MRTLCNYLAAAWLALTSVVGHAAMEQAEGGVTEPTVSLVWVFVFFIAFIGVCVGIGIGVYRAEKAGKAAAAENKD
jgi:ABC-type phosphate transport system permease subunit